MRARQLPQLDVRRFLIRQPGHLTCGSCSKVKAWASIIKPCNMKLSSVVKISAVAFPAVSAFNHQAAKKTATSLDQGASAPTRRVFLTQATTSTGLVGSAAAVGWFTNVENGSHGAGCACDSCAGMAPGHSSSCTCSACASNSDHGPVGKYEPGHGPGCSCGICVKLGPNIASAYDRDVGGKSQSADTFAQNIQV